MRIRITIEYDYDKETPCTPAELTREREDWINGDVDMLDIANGVLEDWTITVENVP